MFVKQLSVYIENSQGKLAQLADYMGKNNIDMLAATIADTADFGMLRLIVNDYGNALKILKDEGFAVTVTNVLAVSVKDEPGGLAKALDIFYSNDISVEYFYSFVRHIGDDCVIIVRVDKPEEASDLLKLSGFELLDQENIASL